MWVGNGCVITCPSTACKSAGAKLITYTWYMQRETCIGFLTIQVPHAPKWAQKRNCYMPQISTHTLCIVFKCAQQFLKLAQHLLLVMEPSGRSTVTKMHNSASRCLTFTWMGNEINMKNASTLKYGSQLIFFIRMHFLILVIWNGYRQKQVFWFCYGTGNFIKQRDF